MLAKQRKKLSPRPSQQLFQRCGHRLAVVGGKPPQAPQDEAIVQCEFFIRTSDAAERPAAWVSEIATSKGQPALPALVITDQRGQVREKRGWATVS